MKARATLLSMLLTLLVPVAAGAADDRSKAERPLNTLDTIVSDMKLRNDLPLRGYEHQTVGWYVGPGYNMMGNEPRTTDTLEWWRKAYLHLVKPDHVRALLTWAVIFDGSGQAATDTRVQPRDLRACYTRAARAALGSRTESAPA